MTTTMTAMIQTKQGSVDHLKQQTVTRPTPKNNEVLVKVHATSVTAGDVIMRKLPRIAYLPGQFVGMKYKQIPGHEFAGDVVAVGKDVTRFQIGDAIFGTTTGFSAGTSAEYLCLPETTKLNVMAKKPQNVSYAEAAVVPIGGMTALYLLNKADVRAGQHVLVYGASGSVGSYAVQIAKYFGAIVTGVCSSRNVAMVQALGADTVIDYTQEDFAQNGQMYDVIFDAVGKTSKQARQQSLKPDGQFVTIRSMTKETDKDILALKEMVEAGHLRPYIDTYYPLAELAEAHRYVESKRKRGNVAITIIDSQDVT